jgi:hypothetical protein
MSTRSSAVHTRVFPILLTPILLTPRGVSSHRIDRLEPEHLEKLYARMIERASAAGAAHQAHRTMRTALNKAVRRGHVVRNPAVLAKPPRLTDEEIEPLTIEEVQRLLATATAVAAVASPDAARTASTLGRTLPTRSPAPVAAASAYHRSSSPCSVSTRPSRSGLPPGNCGRTAVGSSPIPPGAFSTFERTPNTGRSY